MSISPPPQIPEFNTAWRKWIYDLYRSVWHPGNFTGLQRGALVSKSGVQTLSTGSTLTVIMFDTEIYDTDSIHSTVTNTGQLVVPTGITKVMLSGTITFAANATGNRRAFIYKNGAAAVGCGRGSVLASDGGYTTIISIQSAVIDVVAGDYFEIQASQESGGNLNVSAGSWFSMALIS